MNEAMEQVKDTMERVATQAARDMKYEIAERIEKQADAISTFLDNGTTIYLHASDSRRTKMHLLRFSLHTKAQTLYETAAMIYGTDITNTKY